MNAKEPASGKTIGSLNGRWAALFKLTVLLVPLCLPWFIWVTVTLIQVNMKLSEGERFTQKNGVEVESRLRNEMRDMDARIALRFNELPPPDVRRRLDTFEAKIDLMMTEMTKITVKIDSKP